VVKVGISQQKIWNYMQYLYFDLMDLL
jgi:hypothetical protein